MIYLGHLEVYPEDKSEWTSVPVYWNDSEGQFFYIPTVVLTRFLRLSDVEKYFHDQKCLTAFIPAHREVKTIEVEITADYTKPDALDNYIEERERKSPGFKDLVEQEREGTISRRP